MGMIEQRVCVCSYVHVDICICMHVCARGRKTAACLNTSVPTHNHTHSCIETQHYPHATPLSFTLRCRSILAPAAISLSTTSFWPIPAPIISAVIPCCRKQETLLKSEAHGINQRRWSSWRHIREGYRADATATLRSDSTKVPQHVCENTHGVYQVVHISVVHSSWRQHTSNAIDKGVVRVVRCFF